MSCRIIFPLDGSDGFGLELIRFGRIGMSEHLDNNKRKASSIPASCWEPDGWVTKVEELPVPSNSNLDMGGSKRTNCKNMIVCLSGLLIWIAEDDKEESLSRTVDDGETRKARKVERAIRIESSESPHYRTRKGNIRTRLTLETSATWRSWRISRRMGLGTKASIAVPGKCVAPLSTLTPWDEWGSCISTRWAKVCFNCDTATLRERGWYR